MQVSFLNFFLPWSISNIAISWVCTHWQKSGAEHSLKTWWSRGKTNLQCAGENPSCGKPRLEPNFLDAEVGALSALGTLCTGGPMEVQEWLVTAFWSSVLKCCPMQKRGILGTTFFINCESKLTNINIGHQSWGNGREICNLMSGCV